jgi:hypothetical protein
VKVEAMFRKPMPITPRRMTSLLAAMLFTPAVGGLE